MQNKANILFLSYNGLLEPILPSQAVPYLTELAKKGFRFTLLTYEKKRDLEKLGPEKLSLLKDALARDGIAWRYLKYHKNPPFLSTLFDLILGAAAVFHIIREKKIDIIHVRGITPGMIALLLSGLLRKKILFDMRGLLAEEYVGGGLWKEGSLVFRMVKTAEKSLLKRCDAVTVLTRKHLDFNKNLDYLKGRGIPMEVVPCCVDMSRFKCQSSGPLRSELDLDGKFVLMYPGKIGTFYLMREMLDFYKTMLSAVPDAIFVILTNDDICTVSETAKELGIDDRRIKIIRSIQFDEMPRYMGIADAGIFFINSYKKIGSSPIKMGEFLASGVPVIINSGIGDTEELVRENNVGVIAERFDEAAYKDAIRQLLDLKKESDALKARCRDTARRYLSLDDAVAGYARIYDALRASNAEVSTKK